MSAKPSHPNQANTPPPSQPGNWASEDDHFRAVLHTIIDRGADFARLLHEQARQAQANPVEPRSIEAQPTAAPSPHLAALAAAFDRIARTVRRSILLARTLREPARSPAQHRAAARERIIRDVEDSIDRQTSHPAKAALEAEFRERLDSPDFEDDLATLPIETIITLIRRDLGLDAPPGAKPWRRRTPTDLAALKTRAAQPPTTTQEPHQKPPHPPDKPPKPPSDRPHRPDPRPRENLGL